MLTGPWADHAESEPLYRLEPALIIKRNLKPSNNALVRNKGLQDFGRETYPSAIQRPGHYIFHLALIMSHILISIDIQIHNYVPHNAQHSLTIDSYSAGSASVASQLQALARSNS